MKRSFKPYQNEHDSVKEAREKGKKPCNVEKKGPWQTCPTTHLFFHLIPPQLFSLKWSLLKAWKKKIKEARKVKQKGRRKGKKKVKTAVSLLNPNVKFCFLHIPELSRLMCGICNKRLWSAHVWPVNSFLVSFSSLLPNNVQNMTLVAFFSKIPRYKWVKFVENQSGCKPQNLEKIMLLVKCISDFS